jgi:hypothetical protein
VESYFPPDFDFAVRSISQLFIDFVFLSNIVMEAQAG